MSAKLFSLLEIFSFRSVPHYVLSQLIQLHSHIALVGTCLSVTIFLSTYELLFVVGTKLLVSLQICQFDDEANVANVEGLGLLLLSRR